MHGVHLPSDVYPRSSISIGMNVLAALPRNWLISIFEYKNCPNDIRVYGSLDNLSYDAAKLISPKLNTSKFYSF